VNEGKQERSGHIAVQPISDGAERDGQDASTIHFCVSTDEMMPLPIPQKL
jgi:hypothetical protein